MSTFGNKGERERNPNKPKFAALDINSLYRSTRGETFEPATQKNAAPRKHGMQSLGKVPSARRPPANLPSLKAETSTPPINSVPAQNSNEQQQQLQQQQYHQTANWIDSNSSGGPQGSSNVVSSNPTLLSNNSNSSSQGNHHHHQGASSNNNNNNNNNSNNNSSTWSAVAIGNVKEDSALQPPLYQSQQFQNEFPSLDGTLMMTNSSTMNVSATQKLQNQNSFDSGGGGGNSGQGANLRPSTDAASWMQQQQQSNSANSGNVRGVGGENGSQNFPIQEIDGPPKVMALMPSFLRGANTGIANISSAPSAVSSSSPGGGMSNQNQNMHHKPNMNYGNNRRQQNNSYNEYSNGLPPPRHHRQQPPRHSGRQNNNNNNNHNINSNNNNNNNNDDRSSSYEPEMIVQRPIIKEEELERIDSLARDDAWSKHDEIDYNKKLQFSDDEADDMKPKDSKMDAWRDSEKRDMKQQNGPRSIDPMYIEKIKMVRDDEERLERERKSAAQRKLQELEEKSKQQKMVISLDKSHDKEMDEKPQTTSGINYTINDSDKKMDHHSSQQQRDYGKSTKYINDNKYNDTYDSQYGRNRNTGEDFKKNVYQSNLPPRFQKQHQHIDDRRDKGGQQSNSNYKPLHQQDSKNIPFVQHPPQFDQQQRWVQYNKGQGPPPRRNMSSLSQSSSDDNRQNIKQQQQSSYNPRRRQESEEDDYGRYIKESSSSTTIKKSTLQTAQISRSMSDSSDKLSDHNRSEKSTSREYLTGSNVCWAEVCENDKRSSLDAKDKRRVSESSAISDDQPRTILQRNKPLNQDQLPMKEMKKDGNSGKESMMKEDEQKTVLNDGPQKDLLADVENVLKKDKMSDSQTVSAIELQLQQQNKKSLEIIPEKEQQNMNLSDKIQHDSTQSSKDMIKSKDVSSKDMDDNRHGGNKRSPHSNRYDQSSRGRGNPYGGYRGTWPKRGSGHPRSGRYDYSDSENSEEYENDWNRGSKTNRKDYNRRDNYGGSNIGQKEGFSPRGEPSRRGRGGSMSGSTHPSSNFRRTGSNSSNTAPVKRIDNYGPPSSKSPFGSNDEKSNASDKKDTAKEKEKLSDDDRTKQKQKALSDGLINKSMKDNSNLAMQKSSSPISSTNKPGDDITSNKQHSSDSQQQQSIQGATNSIQDTKKENDDKMSEKMSSGRGINQASQPYNANRQSKYDGKSNTSTSLNKSTINKPQPMSTTQQQSSGKISQVSSSSTTITNVSSAQSQYASMSSKPTDSRSSNNSSSSNSNSYRDPRANDPRNNGSSRMAPRFVKQQRDTSGTNMGRTSGSGNNYWDKGNVDSMNDESKVSLMQQLSNAATNSSLTSSNTNNNNNNNSNSSGSNSINSNQQQVSTAAGNTNILNSKTDVINKQSGQTSQPQQTTTSSSNQPSNQPMLDGASLPKQTLIFENKSYKTAPPSLKRSPPQLGPQNAMGQHQQQKDSTPTINEMIEQQAKDHSLTSALQNLSFGQKSNDMVEMNHFKFSFDTQLTDDGTAGFGSSSSSAHASQAVSKTSSLGLVGAKTGMQNSNILNTDALNMKVASCKKVWEEPSVEHSSSNADDVMNFVAQQQLQHYAAHNNINAHHTGLSPQSFGYATGSANDHVQSSLEHFNKSNDNDDSNNYQSQHMTAAHVMHSQNQQANMNMKAVEAFSATANVCKVKPTQQQMHQSGLSTSPQQLQQSQLQHQQQFYQTPSYANMPTIPSPPVVYNSAQATAGGLYNPYNMDAARAQMYSYPAASATNNSLSFNAFMQTPSLASAPTHEMYQNLSQYRATVQPFNQTPQLNNPNTAVLISSATASNSMMASKSNTTQQIGAIGSKSSAPQNAQTAPTAGQYNQQYMNHLYHQNSYYPNSTAQQANPYYNAATGTATTGNYGMFSGTTSASPQQQMNYGSVGQFPLNSQMLNNLVINQQYRSGPVVNAASSSSNGGSATSGSNSNTAGAGYMKHQSQLQDPTMKYSNMNDSQKAYNWDISPPSSSSNSYNRGYNNQNSIQNYNSSQHPSSQQRIQKNMSNSQLFPPNLANSQGKSQFYGNSSQPGSK